MKLNIYLFLLRNIYLLISDEVHDEEIDEQLEKELLADQDE